MCRGIVLLACLLWLPLSAVAGPWPRDEGAWFTSITGTYRFASDAASAAIDGTIYAEYGLNGRLTLGIDAMDDTSGYSHVYTFARLPVLPLERRLKLAAGVGLGTSRRTKESGTMMRLELSAGRDFNTRRSGWWSVVAAVENHDLWEARLIKFDATVGLILSPKIKLITDLETSQRDNTDDATTLRGSVAWALRDARHLIVGLEVQDAGSRSYGLRLGFWRSF